MASNNKSKETATEKCKFHFNDIIKIEYFHFNNILIN